MKIVVFFLFLLVGFLLGTVFSVSVFKTRVPAPFLPDYGHRLFAVHGEEAARITTLILARNGMSELFTFHPEGNTQTLLDDYQTVIVQQSDSIGALPPNTITLAVVDPATAAKGAKKALVEAGFTAQIHQVGPIFLVESNAFDGWGIGFRPHISKMGPPPGKEVRYR